MFRCYIDRYTAAYGYSISVRYHTVYHILAYPCLAKHFRCFQAMLFRIKLEINVVKKPYDSPVFSILSISQFVCIPFHDRFHSQCMLDMKWILVVFF